MNWTRAIRIIWKFISEIYVQETFACSKFTIKILEKG